MHLEHLIDEALQEMDSSEGLRERSFRDAREIIRESKRAIQAMHRNEDALPHLEECRRLQKGMLSYLDQEPRGAVEDAMMELSEAFLLHALLDDAELPSAADLEVSTRAWLLGLADVPGEMRRRCLDLLRSGDVVEAELLLKKMEQVHDALMRFDHPDAVLPIRRKQDVSRSVVERTRGDVTAAMVRR